MSVGDYCGWRTAKWRWEGRTSFSHATSAISIESDIHRQRASDRHRSRRILYTQTETDGHRSSQIYTESDRQTKIELDLHRERATDRHRSDIHRQRTSNRLETHTDRVKYIENERQTDGQTNIKSDIPRERATDKHRSSQIYTDRERATDRHRSSRIYTEGERDRQTDKIELDIHRVRATDRETKTESYMHRKRASDRQTSERAEKDGGYLGTYHSLDYKLQPFHEHYSLCRIVWELDCCTVWSVSLSPHSDIVRCFCGRPSMGSILQSPRLHPGLTNDKRIKSRSNTF